MGGARGEVDGELRSLLSRDKIRWISTEAGLTFLSSFLSACSGVLGAG